MTETSSSATKTTVVDSPRTRDCQRAENILRGTQRLLRSLSFESLSEVNLGTGRRADILALAADGDFWIVEIKSSIADFRSDQKWPEYQAYCDCLAFAVAPDFPTEILPAETGLILADAYAGELIRPPPRLPMAPARRKAMTMAMDRLASARLLAQIDPSIRLTPSEQ